MSRKTRVRPTPPPQTPAMVRPALGPLLVSMSLTGCADDQSGDSSSSEPPMAVDTEIPPMPDEGPMTNPTDDGTGSATGGSATSANTAPMPDPTTLDEGPMPNPTLDGTADGTSGGASTGGSSGGVSSDSGSSTGDASSTGGNGAVTFTSGDIPPMPAPTTGVPPMPDPSGDVPPMPTPTGADEP